MKRIVDNMKSCFGLRLLKVVLIMFMSAMLAALNANAQNGQFPVPTGNMSQLFYLQRTPNTNTIVYELNQKNGTLNEEDPLHVFWIRYQESGQQTELSFIQRKFAYGINSKKIEKDKFELRFVSYKKYVLYLMKAKDNKYHVYATVNGKLSILNRIFIHIKSGGSFWSPNIDYVELDALDPLTGAAVTGTIKV